MPDQAYVYILANSFQKLYTGVTTRLMLRILEHKNEINPHSHTARYGIDRLIYYECFSSIIGSYLKGDPDKIWNRMKKLQLHRLPQSNLARPEPPMGEVHASLRRNQAKSILNLLTVRPSRIST